MTEEEKKTLVDAVNCKYPHQNLTEIYYNIGRALPFTAQRFPDGRVSDWYRNQYVEVVRVEPHGRGGKFGNVFGFYYRNGERADAYENDPEHSWCTKDDTEPQPIPCCGCGSWRVACHCFMSFGLCDKNGTASCGYKSQPLSARQTKKSPWQYSLEVFQGIPPRIFLAVP